MCVSFHFRVLSPPLFRTSSSAFHCARPPAYIFALTFVLWCELLGLMSYHLTVDQEMAAQRPQRARRNPRQDALYYCSLGEDKEGFDIRYIDSFKGRGVFSSRPFQKGDFLLEYRGQLISKKEQESRLKVYHDALKVFMFDFQFNGKLLCIDAAREDGSLGRLINDDEVSPNSKMTITRVNGEPHLCLFAIKDIGPGEEITYNYGDSEWPWRIKKSKEKPSQSAEENPSTSRSSPDDTSQKSKEKPSQSAEENPPTSRSYPDDTPQKSKEKPSQSAEENPPTSGSYPDDTPQKSKEKPSQSAEENPPTSGSYPDDTPQKSKEKPSQSAEENPPTSRSYPDDTPQKSKEKPSQSAEENPPTSGSYPDDTPQKSKEKPSQSAEENPPTSRSYPDDTPQVNFSLNTYLVIVETFRHVNIE
ncbi:uncharacterized protein LOC144991219 isoform X2 [Oryzias latipes]